jgi:hypothetical protein
MGLPGDGAPAGIEGLLKPAWVLGFGDSSAVEWMHSWILSRFGKRFGFPHQVFCTLVYLGLRILFKGLDVPQNYSQNSLSAKMVHEQRPHKNRFGA